MRKKQLISITLSIILLLLIGIGIYHSAREQYKKDVLEQARIIAEEQQNTTAKSTASEQETEGFESLSFIEKLANKQAKPTANLKTQQAERTTPANHFKKHLSQNSSLHAMGVYKGEDPSGKKEESWWTKCGHIQGNNSEKLVDCQKKYASQQLKQHTIKVSVSYSKTPVVLALMAFEPVLWDISTTSPEVQIEGVILAGFHGQDVTGVSHDIPVAAFTYESPKCKNCQRGIGHFYAYDNGKQYQKAASQLLEITGKDISSFQAANKAHYFALNNHAD